MFTVLLLGRVAVVAQRPIVIKLSRERSVGLCVGAYVRRSVGASVCHQFFADSRRYMLSLSGKTADRIRIPFGIIGRTGPGMRQVVGFGDRSTGRGTFGANLGRTIVTNGDFTAYVCDSAATRPSSQITLGRLVIRPIHINSSHALYCQPYSQSGWLQ